MKKFVVITFLILITLLTAEEPKEENDFLCSQNPLYEKVLLIRDYRINQPIKGAIRWGSLGMFASYIGGEKVLKHYDFHHDWSTDKTLEVAWETSKVCMLVGGLYGLYRGFQEQAIKKKIPNYCIDKNKIGYEFNLMLGSDWSGNEITNKMIEGFSINYDFKYKFIDELQLSMLWVDWPELEETNHTYDEKKYDIRANRYFLDNYAFSPYYGIGIGVSNGKRRHDYYYYENRKILSEGIYPYIHAATGIRINFLDFFYLKIETDLELSSFYFYAKSHEDYVFLHNVAFGLIFGAKVF